MESRLIFVLIAYIGGVICGDVMTRYELVYPVLIAYIGGVICGIALKTKTSLKTVLIAYIGGVICGARGQGNL